ncbi:arabinan endo-1,5-alpha-L-arabinosidase [Allostreptomyces psammosilenae]|uniref:Arabinan endo-1,5-alpha-L-arabinosidase n=1 Tax=Allostreptomyces psammosilenae TaxID=1892865 RepID=A0A853A394_9ACTN|nr:arabinan endo-1,5-alpha-L-arabinosidase [Allostreptomyces psammosilenae]NYI04948.1 arabinan endo-1,5-alpha-L-arabinosidase [Allostreptomyces psammosilenae]
MRLFPRATRTTPADGAASTVSGTAPQGRRRRAPGRAVLALLLTAPLALLPAAAGAAPKAYPNPGLVTGTVTVHDPSMIRTSSGYILYGTHNETRTSTDRIAFADAGPTLNPVPSWVRQYNSTGDIWAPDVSYHNGRYWMYYSASSFGSNNSAIGLATSSTGRPGSWTDQGIVYSTTTSSNHNAIDPSLMVDPQGRWWLAFGSYWSGIRMIQLDPSTGKRLNSNSTLYHLATRPDSPYAVEGPTLIRRGNYYYLFASYDRCCAGTDSTYNIRVGRSTSPTGPFVDRNGTPMLQGGGTTVLASHGNIIGPGGQSVLQDSDGDLLVYHYYDGADNGTAKLGVNLLGWDSAGWPYVY